MTDRRVEKTAIASAITASGTSASRVEKAAGLRRGELKSFLNGSDIGVAPLVAAGGFLGLSPIDLYREGTR